MIRDKISCIIVTPLVGVWIEITSLPFPQYIATSLPLWECGLKLSIHLPGTVGSLVTPLVGVWIEIRFDVAVWFDYPSLPLWECGLKYYSAINLCRILSHSPCGSVDWNLIKLANQSKSLRHSPCGSVDWNNHLCDFRICSISHSPCGSVDWNQK